MKITFLGTGTSQGVPVIACDCEVCTSLDYRDKRLRSSIHISIEDKSFVVDSGPDFRQQMLSNRINRLDAILFTHAHRDHTAGMDDVRAYNNKYDLDIPIYAQQIVLDQLKNEYHYIFNNQNYPGLPRIIMNSIENESFKIENVEFTPILVHHYKLPVFGYRVGDFTYITDAKTIDETELDKIKGSKVLVINALQHEQHISHLTFDEAIELAEKIGAETTYFTHISHKLGKSSALDKKLPPKIKMAYDGLVLQVS